MRDVSHTRQLARRGLAKKTRTGRAAPSARAGADDGTNTEKILEAAERCFRRSGYSDTSLREVAAEAGVSKSLVLYHFGSKERLFVDTQLRISNRLAASVAEAAAAYRGDPADRALLALDTLIANVRENNDLAANALLGVQAHANKKLEIHARRLRTDLRKLLHDTVWGILAEDRDRLPLSLDEIVDLLWATLAGLGVQMALDESPIHVDRALTGLRTLFAIALEAKPNNGGNGAP